MLVNHIVYRNLFSFLTTSKCLIFYEHCAAIMIFHFKKGFLCVAHKDRQFYPLVRCAKWLNFFVEDSFHEGALLRPAEGILKLQL